LSGWRRNRDGSVDNSSVDCKEEKKEPYKKIGLFKTYGKLKSL